MYPRHSFLYPNKYARHNFFEWLGDLAGQKFAVIFDVGVWQPSGEREKSSLAFFETLPSSCEIEEGGKGGKEHLPRGAVVKHVPGSSDVGPSCVLQQI